MRHKFRLPIGDWSDDGHGKCDYYMVESDKDLRAVADSYIAMDKKYKLSEQCAEYEEGSITDLDFIDKVKEGLDIEVREDEHYSSEELANLLIKMLNAFDKTLNLEIIEEEMPTLNTWFDIKVNLPGYGCFS